MVNQMAKEIKIFWSQIGVQNELECLTSGLYYKSFKIVIYDHNDSGLYYKATMLGS